MVASCEKCGKIAQTTSPSRFQLDLVAIPRGISLISCCYTQPPRWLTVKDYFPFYLHSFTLSFYMQSYGKDHYMPQLKLSDVIRIEIKNHDVLLPKTLRESFMVTRYYWLITLWWTKVPKEIIFSIIFLMAPVSLNINF